MQDGLPQIGETYVRGLSRGTSTVFIPVSSEPYLGVESRPGLAPLSLGPRSPPPPPPLDAAMASELSEVDKRMVMAGGTVAANLPQVFRKLRLSSVTDEFSWLSMMRSFSILIIEYRRAAPMDWQ